MAGKRNKHSGKGGFKGNTPKAVFGAHVVGNRWYHTTKGWRKIRAEHHQTPMNILLIKFGIAPIGGW